MAAHNVLPQIFYSGSWHLIPADVLNERKIKTTRGVTDDGQPRPCKIEWTFNNVLDNYRPSNPSGPLYGLLQRNMPVALACDLSVRAAAEATSFSPDQTPEFDQAAGRGLRWVDLVAEGQLARITGWDEPLRSPMYRQINRYTSLKAYLPFEDKRNTENPLNAAPGGGPGFAIGAQFAGGDGPSGAGTATAMTATSRVGVPVLSMSSTGGWQLFYSVMLDAAPSSTPMPFLTWTTANGYTYSWNVNDTTYQLVVTDSDGTNLVSSGVSFGAGANPAGQWITFRFKVTQTGGTTSVEVGWYPQDSSFLYGYTPTFAGNVSRPTNVRVYGNANIDGALYSHLGVLAGVADNLQSYDAVAAFNGYRDELAGNRFNRLCDQLGIAHDMVGSAADTWPMGPQKPDTAINLLKECALTEDGLLFDRLAGLGLTFRTRKSMTNQTAKMTLAYLGDVGPPLVERIDTADIANEVTVSQRDGGSATAALTVGALSNQAPPAGIGTKKGGQDVNVADEVALPVLAGWHLSRRTVEGSRYDTVVLDLDGNPGLTTAANSVDVGDRIVITGREPEPIELIVYGIVDSIETDRRKVTFTCVPGAVYAIALYSTASSRYDVDGSTVAAAAPTTTATAWNVSAATTDDLWSQTSTPYEWLVAGERVRVTFMGAPTGTGPYVQPATVVRSINGVVKAQTVGTEVHMAPRTDSTAGAARYTIGRGF